MLEEYPFLTVFHCSNQFWLSFRAHSHSPICNCDLFFPTIGCIGVREVVVVAQCEHFRWVLYNPFLAKRRIAVATRIKRTVWTGLYNGEKQIFGNDFAKLMPFLYTMSGDGLDIYRLIDLPTTYWFLSLEFQMSSSSWWKNDSFSSQNPGKRNVMIWRCDAMLFKI